MKSKNISKKDIQTLQKFGQGAAARNYTKKLKFEMVKKIGDLRKPIYKKGSSLPQDSNQVMISEKDLQDIMTRPENLVLTWNNYFVDIGQGRQYQGHWDKTVQTKSPTIQQQSPRGKQSIKKDKVAGCRGFGIIVYPDKSKYEGFTENSIFEGIGRMTHANGDIYQGHWKNGKADGHGVFCDTQGSHYEGVWKDDQQHGIGKETWDYNKNSYHGEFKSGQKNGKGKAILEDCTYEGDFKDGMFHGHGVYTFDNGKDYEGQFSRNNLEGYGKMTYSDKSSYIGFFLNAKKNGEGTRYYANGNIHEGSWLDDQPHGEGQFYRASDKTKQQGVWSEGKLIEKWQVAGTVVQGKVNKKQKYSPSKFEHMGNFSP